MIFKKSFVMLFVAIFLMNISIAFGDNQMNQTKSDLVDIQKLEPSIYVDLKYAGADNFFKQALYSANRAYLRKSTAEKLIIAHKKLQERGLGLKIWDAYRPLSVQKIMWELKPDANFVANPATGSDHNRACAVDVTLVDKNGKELVMPTKFDDFSVKAKADYKKLPRAVKKNREILRNALTSEGFIQYKNEWWHFTDEDAKSFDLLDVSFEELAKLEDIEKQSKDKEKHTNIFTSLEGIKIIFDFSEIKKDFNFVKSTPVYITEEQMYAYKGVTAENKPQDFYLEVYFPNIALFNNENYELVLALPQRTLQSSFFVNNERNSPKEKIFNLFGKVVVKNEIFMLRCRGINWQENEKILKIKVFRYK